MKRKILTILLSLGLLVSLPAVPAMADENPTPEEIEASVQNGIEWLVEQQNPDGSWYNPWEPVASTAFAVVKLEDRAYELGYESPFDPEYPYNSNVEAGLDYILSQAVAHPAGGICFTTGSYVNYVTGIAMMAIAASRTPDETVPSGPYAGMTYKQVLQGNVDYLAVSQNPDGGWRYVFGPQESDNSITGYVVLGLRYAEAPLYKFECSIPGTVKTGLNNWIAIIQDPVDGDIWDGGSRYTPTWAWYNLLKTGNLLFEMSFVGDGISTQRVIDALDYIERWWDDPGADEGGIPWWREHYQAMYCLMKGFDSLDIDTITVIRDSESVEVNWFDEIAAEIIAHQHAGGFWPAGARGDEIMNTEWALLTLEKISPPPPVNVEIDVPNCACDDDGYDVVVTYTVERIPSDGTVEVYRNGELEDIVILIGFSGTESVTYDIALDTPGMHTWKAVLDVTTEAGAQAHAEDTDSINVCETPEVLDIPDQAAPFETFDLDDYLVYDGGGGGVFGWSVSGIPAGWTVAIDPDNVVTVTVPEGAVDPATITFTANVTCCDGVICSDSDDATFIPNLPPDCSEAYAEPGCLWPPNHKFVEVSIMGVTDPDGDLVTITIYAITSDEPTASDKGSGGATHAPDASGIDTDTASIRAERSGNGDGRVYVIQFTASDGRGGECEGSVMVKVPHDQSAEECLAIDSGQDYDATEIN